MAAFIPVSTGTYYQKKWSAHFLTEDFLEQHKTLELEQYSLSCQQLQQRGIEVSHLRGQFLQKAVDEVVQEGQMKNLSTSDIKGQVEKIRSRKSTKERRKTWAKYCDYMEEVPAGSRKIRAKRNSLSLQEKIQIACRILIKKELFQEVAKELRTSR